MSVHPSDMHRRCDACDCVVFDAKPCVTCFETDRSAGVCAAHRGECHECGELVCFDHAVTAQRDGRTIVACQDCARLAVGLV